MNNLAVTRVIKFPDDLLQIGRQLVEDKTRMEFSLGELCILVVDEFTAFTKTEALTELAKQIGEEFTNLWVYEWVSRSIPVELRQAYPQLQYSHWRALAGKLDLLPDALAWVTAENDSGRNVSVSSLKVFLHGKPVQMGEYDPAAHLQQTRQALEMYADKTHDRRARFAAYLMNGCQSVHCPDCAHDIPLARWVEMWEGEL